MKELPQALGCNTMRAFSQLFLADFPYVRSKPEQLPCPRSPVLLDMKLCGLLSQVRSGGEGDGDDRS